MRLAVIGSRGWQDDRLLAAWLDALRPHVTLVVSGGADGPDKMGARWGRRNSIATEIHEPDTKRKHPYHYRNRLIAEACQGLIAFWDGRSSGTAYTTSYAQRLGRVVVVVRPGQRPDPVEIARLTALAAPAAQQETRQTK